MLAETAGVAKGLRPARLDPQAVAAAVGPSSLDPPVVAWGDLQALRRGLQQPEPWLERLEAGLLSPDPLLLAALWGRLDRPGVQRLLASPAGRDPVALLAAGRAELPSLAGQPAVLEAWLPPLLAQHSSASSAEALLWLELLGLFRHPAAAERLRAAITGALAADAPAAMVQLAPLLPLLGRQREAADGALLQRLALQPAAAPLRRAALEGLAVGLSAWPVPALAASLTTLARDLDPTLAAAAVDLLARLPEPAARPRLRQLWGECLDPGVRQRLQRRLRLSPLVLVVHGRQGGQIPPELLELAAALEQRRGAPVLLQALTGAPPEADQSLWSAARRAGAFTLVPLLLLPGGHVRTDLPAIAAAWRAQVARTPAVVLRRLPFLGAWPAWQRALAAALAPAPGARWLHHPLEGALADRYLRHLAAVLGHPGLATPYSAATADLALPPGVPLRLLPLTLAANRLSESLQGSIASGCPEVDPPLTLLPPLLEIPAVRQFLLSALEALP